MRISGLYFDAERLPKQHKIAAFVHKNHASELQKGSNQMKNMCSSMRLPEAKKWI